MTPKAIIVLATGIIALAVTAWKGPGAWSAIAAGVTFLALFVGTLGIVPAKDAEYIQDLEDALAKTNTQDAASAIAPGKSRARFLRRAAQ